jgi:hypothetical protein
MHISRANDKLKSGHQLCRACVPCMSKQVRDVLFRRRTPLRLSLSLAFDPLGISSKLLSVLKLAQGFLDQFPPARVLEGVDGPLN